MATRDVIARRLKCIPIILDILMGRELQQLQQLKLWTQRPVFFLLSASRSSLDRSAIGCHFDRSRIFKISHVTHLP